MAGLLYIHGFLSSPQSYKARLTRDWLAQHRPEIAFHCPFLPPYPAEAAAILQAVVNQYRNEPLYLLGSSLGGYWASWLVEKYDLPAVLLNPATDPNLLDPDYIGVPLQNYHRDETYLLDRSHLNQLIGFDTPSIKRRRNYWLLVQTGDETLDYRSAVRKYSACRQTIIEGGDHAFQNTERYLADFIAFFENFSGSC